jgi:hypothetical protein
MVGHLVRIVDEAIEKLDLKELLGSLLQAAKRVEGQEDLYPF